VKQLLTVYWFAYAIVAVATLLYFWPLFGAYPQLVIPSPYPDALEFIWTTWRMQGVIEGSEELYKTDLVFAPGGASLLLHTVCEGLLLPATYLFIKFDPVWRLNISIVLAFLLNGFAAVSFFRSLGAMPSVSAIGSLLVVFAPNQIGHLTAGHLNFLVLFPLLELCRFLVITSRCRGEETVTRIDSGRVVLAIAVMARTNLYFLYYAMLLSAAYSVWWMWRREGLVAKLTTVWLAVIGGLLLNATHLYRIAALARSKRYTPDHDPSTTSADLIAYLVPSSLQRTGLVPDLQQLRSSVVFHEGETSLYVGMALLLAVVITCSISAPRRRKELWFFVIGSCAAILMSFGPWITIGGVQIVRNPFDAILRSVLPLYPSVPARFGVFVGIFVVSIVVLGVSIKTSRITHVLLTLLLVLALVEQCPIRCNVTQLALANPTLEHLRNDEAVKIVVDQPMIIQQAMLRQTIHGKALVGGFLSRRPRKEERELRANRFLQRVGPSEREHSIAELRAGWCALGADALILEEARSGSLKQQLLEAGFSRVDEDGVLVIFKPRDGMCRAEARGAEGSDGA
jgi:hypothetical protein